MKKQTSEIEEKVYNVVQKIGIKAIQSLLQDEKKKWKEEISREMGLSGFTLGTCSARREDLGTPKADPESEYNKGYRDATNAMKEQLRVKLNKV